MSENIATAELLLFQFADANMKPTPAVPIAAVPRTRVTTFWDGKSRTSGIQGSSFDEYPKGSNLALA